VPLFNAPHLPAPPLPPENITTEQDRQTQIHYEQWLNHQNQIVTSQLKYYETEVNKLRKMRKVSQFCFLSWVGGEIEFLEAWGKWAYYNQPLIDEYGVLVECSRHTVGLYWALGHAGVRGN